MRLYLYGQDFRDAARENLLATLRVYMDACRATSEEEELIVAVLEGRACMADRPDTTGLILATQRRWKGMELEMRWWRIVERWVELFILLHQEATPYEAAS